MTTEYITQTGITADDLESVTAYLNALIDRHHITTRALNTIQNTDRDTSSKVPYGTSIQVELGHIDALLLPGAENADEGGVHGTDEDQDETEEFVGEVPSGVGTVSR
jgi:hypothetical protein